MPEFWRHPIFTPLRLDLSQIVAGWIDQLKAAGEDATGVYMELSTWIQDGSPIFLRLPAPDQQLIRRWFESLPIRKLLAAIEAPDRQSLGIPKPANPGQLRLIEEAQRELSVDFTGFFPVLTAWQADVVLKGLLVVSEVLRQTGERHFHPRDVRRAVKEYLAHP